MRKGRAFIRCDHCGKGSDIILLPADSFKHPVMPATLTDLPDRNNVDWLCPKCGIWNLTSDAQLPRPIADEKA